jgi:phosphoribosylformylglycinamidine synthase
LKVAVVTFPGSNCDADTRYALDRLGAAVRTVWHSDHELGDVDAVVLPGGFSYGDYLRSGAMAALAPIVSAIRDFAARGGPVLGICNGFQILTECGLLPGQLARNDVLHFLCRPVHVRVERGDTPFTAGYGVGEVLELPIAHHDGRYFLDAEGLARLEGEGRVALRYCDAAGARVGEANPNGSVADIAAILNARGNVMGMMPHPERAVEPLLGSTHGRRMFTSMLGSFAAGAA